MKIGTEIVLKNVRESVVIANLGDNMNTDIDDVVFFEPGALVPVVLENVGKVACYGRILSLTITELKTHVIFECVEVSDDVADAAYSIYKMTSGNSVIGSYTSGSSSRSSRSSRRSEYSLKNDTRPELDSYRNWNY